MTTQAMRLDLNRRSAEPKDIEPSLRGKIVGQDEAVQAVVDLYQVFRAGLNSPAPSMSFTVLFKGCSKNAITSRDLVAAQTRLRSARGESHKELVGARWTLHKQPVFQGEAYLPSQRNVFPPKRHPWWARVIFLAWVGILFVLAMLLSSALSGKAGGSARCLVQADGICRREVSIC
jgi:hypothetical protein